MLWVRRSFAGQGAKALLLAQAGLLLLPVRAEGKRGLRERSEALQDRFDAFNRRNTAQSRAQLFRSLGQLYKQVCGSCCLARKAMPAMGHGHSCCLEVRSPRGRERGSALASVCKANLTPTVGA